MQNVSLQDRPGNSQNGPDSSHKGHKNTNNANDKYNNFHNGNKSGGNAQRPLLGPRYYIYAYIIIWGVIFRVIFFILASADWPRFSNLFLIQIINTFKIYLVFEYAIFIYFNIPAILACIFSIQHN